MHGCRKEERTNAVDSFSCPVTDLPSIHRGHRPLLSEGGRAGKRRFSELREVQELSWRELPATMPRSNLIFPPPPAAHAGLAMSSLPRMLINWLGCQSKHSYSRGFFFAFHCCNFSSIGSCTVLPAAPAAIVAPPGGSCPDNHNGVATGFMVTAVAAFLACCAGGSCAACQGRDYRFPPRPLVNRLLSTTRLLPPSQ
jgi:hypothetical protein